MPTIVKWCAGSLFALLLVSAVLVFNPTFVMAQSGLTELVPSGPTAPPVVSGPSPWGAGVKLAASLLGWLSDVGLKANINSKIDELKPEIDKAMPAKGGVLIVIGIQQWERPD